MPASRSAWAPLGWINKTAVRLPWWPRHRRGDRYLYCPKEPGTGWRCSLGNDFPTASLPPHPTPPQSLQQPCWEAGDIPHKMVLWQRGGPLLPWSELYTQHKKRSCRLSKRRCFPALAAQEPCGAELLGARETAGIAAAMNTLLHIKQGSVT